MTLRTLSTHRFPAYATSYFGGDVQSFSFVRVALMEYEIRQVPHWLPPRTIARCLADSAEEAQRIFCKMARDSGTDHA